jgi:Putative zinc-finger
MSEPFDRALRAAARRSRPAGVCPDAAMLASYADNGLLEDERRAVEAHAADCPTCLEHLALLGAVSLDREAPEPSRSWLAQWSWLVPVAAAVLVVAVWVRLPEQKASQDVPAATAPASQARAPVASEQERAAAASPSAGRDEASNAAPRVAAKVSKAAPARPAPPADAKFGQLKPFERRDEDARQKAAAASPPPVPATVAAPAQKEALEGRRAVGQASAQAAPPAAQAPALADAVKEEVQVAESPRRRESDLLKSTRATSAPLVVSASPKESYRIVGNRIELSEDGGATWRTVASVLHVTLTVATCAPGGPCWFGGTDGQLLRRTPDGFSRSALPVRQRVVTIAPDGPQTAIATVDGGLRFRTTDGGATWQPIP